MVIGNDNNLILWDTAEHLNQEIHLILSEISQFAYFDSNKKNALKPERLSILNIQKSFNQINIALDYINKEKDLNFFGSISKLNPSTDFLKLIISIEKGISLEVAQLNQLVLLIEAAKNIDFDISPLDSNLLRDHKLNVLVKKFRNLVDDDGEIDTRRHPELLELENKILDIEERSRRKIQELSNDRLFSDALQFAGHDLMNDRYVMPIKTDSFQSSMGLIVSRSETGSTLFVEPFEIKDLSQKRIEYISQFKKILFSIERDLSQELAIQSPLLKIIFFSIEEIDQLIAKAKFCQKRHLEQPIILNQPGFKFESLFHPLINDPIKNDVSLSNASIGLVISGPNTGGKTALLKAIALSYHFLSWGLFIPALSAEMYPYPFIHFSSLDLQNISQGLSSFSGEVTHYIDLFKRIKTTNLIIVDEIFNSTSSDEASALAFSMLHHFHQDKKSQFIISTHHELLKRLTSADQRFTSGSMGFDLIKLKPTFKYLANTPGSSMALQIFSRLTPDFPLSQSITQDARTHLDNQHNQYEKLLSEVSQRLIQISEDENNMKMRLEELKKREKDHEGLLYLKKQDELNNLGSFIQNIEKEAKALLQDVSNGEISKVKKVDERLFTLKSQLAEQNPIKQTPTKSDIKHQLLPPQSLKVGSKYFATTLSKDGILKAIDWKKKSVLIGSGVLQWFVPFDSLAKALDNTPMGRVEVQIHREKEALFHLDVRGMRLDEFQHQIDQSLGQLLAGDIPSLSVIHGHGDGILKSWLRQMIGRSKDFSWQVPETGNDGETEIKLKL
jgi:DNA mismatch repair protein MutS2